MLLENENSRNGENEWKFDQKQVKKSEMIVINKTRMYIGYIEYSNQISI